MRVSYSPGDEAVTRLIESLRPESLMDTGLRIAISSPCLRLFDSVYPGVSELANNLALIVPIGRYAIHSTVLREPGTHMLVVHRLVRIGDTGT